MERGANIICELAGWAVNTDATDFVLPNPERQAQCMKKALKKAHIKSTEIDFISTHATSTYEGDIREIAAIKEVFGEVPTCYINNSKSFWGSRYGSRRSFRISRKYPIIY